MCAFIEVIGFKVQARDACVAADLECMLECGGAETAPATFRSDIQFIEKNIAPAELDGESEAEYEVSGKLFFVKDQHQPAEICVSNQALQQFRAPRHIECNALEAAKILHDRKQGNDVSSSRAAKG